MNRVVAELFADLVDRISAAIAEVERRQRPLWIAERQLRERDAYEADGELPHARAAIELEDDSVDLDVDAGRRDRSRPRERVEIGVPEAERDSPGADAALARAGADALAESREHPLGRRSVDLD